MEKETGIVVRDAHPGDYLALGGVILRSIKAGYTWVHRWWASDRDFETYFLEEHGKWRQILVAEADGRHAGFSCLVQDYVDEFFVDPDFWGRGVADALMRESIQLYPERLELDCFEQNGRGRRFYERHGFRFVHTWPCPFDRGSVLIRYRRDSLAARRDGAAT